MPVQGTGLLFAIMSTARGCRSRVIPTMCTCPANLQLCWYVMHAGGTRQVPSQQASGPRDELMMHAKARLPGTVWLSSQHGASSAGQHSPSGPRLCVHACLGRWHMQHVTHLQQRGTGSGVPGSLGSGVHPTGAPAHAMHCCLPQQNTFKHLRGMQCHCNRPHVQHCGRCWTNDCSCAWWPLMAGCK